MVENVFLLSNEISIKFIWLLKLFISVATYIESLELCGRVELV